MKNTILLFLLIFSLFTSCKKENTAFHDASFNDPVITGYFLRDVNAQPAGVIGNPNVKLGTGTEYLNSEYFITNYPNPFRENFNLHIKSPNNDLKKIWVTRAYWVDEITGNTTIINNSNNISIGGTALLQYETTVQHPRITINLSDFGKGYYRVYVYMNNELFYDNMVNY